MLISIYALNQHARYDCYHMSYMHYVIFTKSSLLFPRIYFFIFILHIPITHVLHEFFEIKSYIFYLTYVSKAKKYLRIILHEQLEFIFHYED